MNHPGKTLEEDVCTWKVRGKRKKDHSFPALAWWNNRTTGLCWTQAEELLSSSWLFASYVTVGKSLNLSLLINNMEMIKHTWLALQASEFPLFRRKKKKKLRLRIKFHGQHMPASGHKSLNSKAQCSPLARWQRAPRFPFICWWQFWSWELWNRKMENLMGNREQ